MGMEALFWLGLGAVGAVSLLVLFRLIAPAKFDVSVFGAICAIYALYAGIAIGGPLSHVIAESVIALIVPVIILRFWDHRVILMPAFLLAHVGLDLVHHLLSIGYPPLWYVQACLSMDVILAAGAYVLMRRDLNNKGNSS